MRSYMQMGILAMLLFAVSDLFADSCPLKGTAAAHVMVFQVDSPSEGGWRPVNKMTVDITLQNVSDSTINAIQLSADYNAMQRYTVALLPRQSMTLYYDPVIDVQGTPPIIVKVWQVKYADGMIVDGGPLCSFDEASALVEPPSRFTTCPESLAVSLPNYQALATAGISPPRIVHQESLPVTQFGNSPDAPKFLMPFPTIPVKRGTVVFSYIIASTGTTCGIAIKQGSWGEKVDQAEIEILKKAVYFPAVKKNVPISVRVDVPMTW